MSAATLQPLDPASLRHILGMHMQYKVGRPGGRLANLSYIDLTDIKLEGVDLSDANLTGARLYGASLRDANFIRANLFGCDLRNADLRFARLDRADLRGASLRGANLSAASLVGCDLREGVIAFKDEKHGLRLMQHERRAGELDYAIMTGADLSGARMTGNRRHRHNLAGRSCRAHACATPI
ncbi:MAG: pentapeptide repeat-containing protein [Asticcacaulis sp.]